MRRAWALALVAIALTLTPSSSGSSFATDAATASTSAAAPSTTVPPTPPTTDAAETTLLDNPFLPEDANIGDCVSAIPRPECGSSARGGWRQALAFGVVILALAVIGLRLVVSVRRRDRSAGLTH